jgi:hypothetical protein
VSGGARPDDPASAAVAGAFRDERPIVLATLIRQVGDFQLAEDAVQDAFEAAVTAGGATGFPPIPERGSPPPRGGGRSIACAATGRWPIAPSGWPS